MYNTFSLKCSFEVLNHIIIMNWAYPRTQEQIELLYWTPEAWEIEFRYKTMYMKILVNWFLLGDQEAGPTDQAARPDPWQGAAHTEEGLQLQVFIKFKDLVETKSTPLCAATWRKSAPRQLGARRDRLGGCQTSLSRKPSCLLQVWAGHEDVNIKVQKVIACKWKCWWQWYLSSYTSGKMLEGGVCLTLTAHMI